MFLVNVIIRFQIQRGFSGVRSPLLPSIRLILAEVTEMIHFTSGIFFYPINYKHSRLLIDIGPLCHIYYRFKTIHAILSVTSILTNIKHSRHSYKYIPTTGSPTITLFQLHPDYSQISKKI